MSIAIKYEEIYEPCDCADIDTVRVKLPAPVWKDFPADCSVSHLIDIFSRPCARRMVMIVDDKLAVSNSSDLRHSYHKDRRRMKVLALDKLERDDRMIGEAGLI